MLSVIFINGGLIVAFVDHRVLINYISDMNYSVIF
jgi:hypothetical protein